MTLDRQILQKDLTKKFEAGAAAGAGGLGAGWVADQRAAGLPAISDGSIKSAVRTSSRSPTSVAATAQGTGGSASAFWICSGVVWTMLRREGWRVSRKRVYRLYKLDGLEVRTKKRRKDSQPGACAVASGNGAQPALGDGFRNGSYGGRKHVSSANGCRSVQ